MSASPIARQACSHAQTIPSRKVLLTDPSQMPDVYSSTPGGTLYSTTPGGEFRVAFPWSKIYCRNSIPWERNYCVAAIPSGGSMRSEWENKGGGGAMIIIQAGFDNFSFNLSIFAAAGWLLVDLTIVKQRDRRRDFRNTIKFQPAAASWP